MKDLKFSYRCAIDEKPGKPVYNLSIVDRQAVFIIQIGGVHDGKEPGTTKLSKDEIEQLEKIMQKIEKIGDKKLIEYEQELDRKGRMPFEGSCRIRIGKVEIQATQSNPKWKDFLPIFQWIKNIHKNHNLDISPIFPQGAGKI